MSEKIDQPDEQLGYLLTQACFLKQRIVNAALRELDLTYVQFVILAGTHELGEGGKVVTQQTISTKRRLDKAMVSNVVKTLIAKELIIREKHPVDHRSYTLRLTEEGKYMAAEGKRITLEIDEVFFANVNHKRLQKALTKLLMNDTMVHP